jgi:hypothetical protein
MANTCSVLSDRGVVRPDFGVVDRIAASCFQALATVTLSAAARAAGAPVPPVARLG